MKTLISALIGLGLGVLALFVANEFLKSNASTVETFRAALTLTKEVVGFVTLAVGFGSFALSAYDKGGIRDMTAADAAGPGVVTIAGALLLV